MSFIYDDDRYKSNSDQRSIGSISGWDEITTKDPETGEIPRSDHKYTIVDIEIMLRAVRKMFNPDYLIKIEEMIYRHANDTDNPHQIDLSDLNTDTVNELYLVWKEEGYTGSREQFLKVLFQYVEIADIETCLKGEAYDKLTPVKGVAEMVRVHNESEDSHDILLNKIFPGSEILNDPSYSIKAYVGLPYDVSTSVVRSSKMWVISSTGVLKELAANTLEADYSLGNAALPIFGPVTNLALGSESLSGSYYSVHSGTLSRSSIHPDMRNNSMGSMTFFESKTSNPVFHGLEYINTGITTVANKYYTISYFVKDHGRHCCGISVPEACVNTEYPFAHFNMQTEQVFVHDEVNNIFGYIYPVYTGWYRVQMTFKATGASTLKFRIYPLDIYDGDFTYNGLGEIGICIFGVMCTQTEYITPYIPTTTSTASISGTSVKVPISTDWYSPVQGTFVMDYKPHHTHPTSVNKTLLNVANGTSNIALSLRYPSGYNNRLYMNATATDNTNLTSIWSNKDDVRMRSTCIYAYSPTKHLGATYGAVTEVNVSKNIHAGPAYFYLGTNRSLGEHLNSYIYGIDYYPTMCEAGHVPFFRGER